MNLLHHLIHKLYKNQNKIELSLSNFNTHDFVNICMNNKIYSDTWHIVQLQSWNTDVLALNNKAEKTNSTEEKKIVLLHFHSSKKQDIINRNLSYLFCYYRHLTKWIVWHTFNPTFIIFVKGKVIKYITQLHIHCNISEKTQLILRGISSYLCLFYYENENRSTFW